MCANNMYRRLIPFILVQNKCLLNNNHQSYVRNMKTTPVLCCNKFNNKSKVLVKVDSFENISDKNKTSYLDMVYIFHNRDIHRRGHVEFIYSALRNMESFGVHKDLEVYKSLIDVLPKGKFIPTNIFQAEFMHYPKQQQCAIDLLQQMEDNAVMPDLEMEDMLVNIFGRRGYPLRKYWRMMYWMPKFKNLSPWPLPKTLPNDSLELAKLAISRMASIDLQTTVTVYKSADIKDSIDDTWIVSAQSPTQRELLENHDVHKPIYVEGSFRIWLQNVSVNYFILRTDNYITKSTEELDLDDVSNIKISRFKVPESECAVNKIPTLHEQEDGTVLAICATGTSSRDSLLSWIRHLEKVGNHLLSKAPVVFTVRSPSTEEITVNSLKSDSSEEMSMIENKK